VFKREQMEKSGNGMPGNTAKTRVAYQHMAQKMPGTRSRRTEACN